MQMIALSVQTTHDKQQVVVCAQTSVAGDVEDRNYFLTPAVAVEVANSMLHAAELCGLEVKIQTVGISDIKRMRLVKRCEHIIRSLSGKKVNYISAQVVDTVLSEVL